MSKALRGLPAVSVGVLLAAVLIVTYAGQSAEADHQPADKVAISGSTMEVFGPGTDVVILQETMRVSTPSDLILQLTAECDILTALATGGMGMADDTSDAEGIVELWIEIDGKRVPVVDSTGQGGAEDNGEVVFCNQFHRQQITDTPGGEEDGDTDQLRDDLQTRQANAFNWLAFNTGSTYDSLSNGQNILDIVVKARLTETSTTGDVAQAVIGARTLVVEPTKTSNHETGSSPTDETSATGNGNGNGPNK